MSSNTTIAELETALRESNSQRRELQHLLDQRPGTHAFWHRHLATSWLRRNHPDLYQQAMNAATAQIALTGGVEAHDYIQQLETVLDLLVRWVDIGPNGLARPDNLLALAGIVEHARRLRPRPEDHQER
jgi:hypothetical protein